MGAQGGSLRGAHRGSLRVLVGAGNKIGLATLPFLVVGAGAQRRRPRGVLGRRTARMAPIALDRGSDPGDRAVDMVRRADPDKGASC